jgi:hypothetical protein
VTGEPLSAALQGRVAAMVAEAVERAVEDIASRLESGEGSWTQAGSAARAEVARWIRSATRTVDGGAQMPVRPAVRHGDEMNGAGEGAGHPKPRGGEMKAVLVVTTPTAWQTASEAIYGPMTVDEEATFVDWLTREFHGGRWPRIAGFPLSPIPAEALPCTTTEGETR